LTRGTLFYVAWCNTTHRVVSESKSRDNDFLVVHFATTHRKLTGKCCFYEADASATGILGHPVKSVFYKIFCMLKKSITVCPWELLFCCGSLFSIGVVLFSLSPPWVAALGRFLACFSNLEKEILDYMMYSSTRLLLTKTAPPPRTSCTRKPAACTVGYRCEYIRALLTAKDECWSVHLFGSIQKEDWRRWAGGRCSLPTLLATSIIGSGRVGENGPIRLL
jgi:hypothetical protein